MDGPCRLATWGWWLLMTVLGMLTLYTLYALFILMIVQVLYVLAAPWTGRESGFSNDASSADIAAGSPWPRLAWPLLLYALFTGVIVLAFLPLAAHSQLMPPENYYWRFQGVWWRHLLRHWAVAMTGSGWVSLWGVTGLAAMALYALGLAEGWRRCRHGLLQVALAGLGIFPLTIIVYIRINREFDQRYTIFAIPALCILAALGVTGLARRIAPRRHVLAAGTAIMLYAVFALWGYRSMVPFKIDWRAATQYLAPRVEPGERVLVSTVPGRNCLSYYLKRLGRGDIDVESTDEAQAKPGGEGSAWAVHIILGEGMRKGDFYGLDVERVGAEPPASRLGELTASLGDPPVLTLGQCDPALLGKGWSRSEAWSDTFSIRWICWLQTHVWLPLAQGGAGTLAIELMPYDYPGAQPQTIRVTIAGQAFPPRELPAGLFTTVQWPVPAGLLEAGYNRIDIELAWTRAPSEDVKNYADFRNLGAAVHSLSWTPSP